MKLTNFEKLQTAVNDVNEVEKGLLDIEYALKESEKLLASQEKGDDPTFLSFLNT